MQAALFVLVLAVVGVSDGDTLTVKDGEARAAAIIKGRPYARKDELVQKKIIPESVYNEIKDQIVAKQ